MAKKKAAPKKEVAVKEEVIVRLSAIIVENAFWSNELDKQIMNGVYKFESDKEHDVLIAEMKKRGLK